jgi:addiction module RelE/StbE family toxin
MKIQWSSTAVADLESIHEYIANDSPAAARRVAKRIKEGVNRLSNFPLSGRAGRVPETRELVVPGTSYIAAYTIQGDEVLIAAVLHGRQNWPESFEERAGPTP